MKWVAIVFLAGLAAAGPFLTSRALGTSEAYNYSLAVADAVQQERASVWPALAGQSEFAFNGRIHPVRTAPYLTAFAGVIDVCTFRQFSFWSLQNLAIALSLVAGALACYWSLRRTTPVEPDTAAFLAAAYVLSPGVLAPAYTMDLYMTVMIVPYLPLVLAGNLIQFERRSFTGLAWLAAALAVCWLAHPPVAVWVGTATVIIQLGALLTQRPKWRDLPAITGAAMVFLALAAFGLASALTISNYRDITHVRDTTTMLGEINRAFPGAIRPVSEQAGQLGDFQLGYGYAVAGLVALGLGLWRRNGRSLLLLAIAALYLALTLPAPGLTPWLWNHAPTLFLNLTNQWPMQRLYLPATALIIFAFALTWHMQTLTRPLLRDIRRIVLATIIGWTCWQSWHYLHRGFASRFSAAETARTHLNSNLELTLISYAIILTPGDFSHGVMDPSFGFRLLAPYDLREVASNWTAPLPPSAENQQGTLFATASDSPDVLDLPHTFTLQPGARYRLTLKFLVPPGDALLQIRGPSMSRKYILPASGGKRAFGMLPGHNPSLSLWTSQSTPEQVGLRLVGAGLGSGSWRGRAFAEFTFERVDPAALPVALKSLLPLRARVRAATAGYLETPRMFIDGYEATVNGRTERVQAATDGLLMVPVPDGESDVEVRYVGPRLVRRARDLTCAAWLAMAAWAFLGWGPTRPREAARRRFAALGRTLRSRAARVSRRAWLVLAGVVLLAGGIFFGWRQWTHARAAVGPVSIRLAFPIGGINRRQPLLVAGPREAGSFVYVLYGDAEHVRFGYTTAKGDTFETEPIRLDRYAEHQLVIDTGVLYPADHPALRELPAPALAKLRGRFRLTLDGQTVIDRDVDTGSARPAEVIVGKNRIGVACEPEFTGTIIEVRRDPVVAR